MSQSIKPSRQIAWRADSDGVRLFIHLTPRASRDYIGKVHVGADGAVLKVRVRALPDKGRANQALIKLTASGLVGRKHLLNCFQDPVPGRNASKFMRRASKF